MLSIALQVNLHTVVHAHQHCMGDAFWSHNQSKGHVFEDDENKATIVARRKQSVNSIGAKMSVVMEYVHSNNKVTMWPLVHAKNKRIMLKLVSSERRDPLYGPTHIADLVWVASLCPCLIVSVRDHGAPVRTSGGRVADKYINAKCCQMY